MGLKGEVIECGHDDDDDRDDNEEHQGAACSGGDYNNDAIGPSYW